MAGITGIGGIFFLAKDAEGLKKWYNQSLGLALNDWGGHSFLWQEAEAPFAAGRTEWSIMPDDTDYLQPSNKNFMINYRVDDLEAYLVELKARCVTQVGEMETYDYGKFAWIVDPEGQKIELWQPIEAGFAGS